LSKVADFSILTFIWRPRWLWLHWNFAKKIWQQKITGPGLPSNVVWVILFKFSRFETIPACVRGTDSMGAHRARNIVI